MELRMSDQLTLHTTELLEAEQVHSAPTPTAINQQSDRLVSELFDIDSRSFDQQQERVVAVRDLGASVQRELTLKSRLLKEPLAKLVNDAEDGGPVGKALDKLQLQTQKINPNKIDFTMGTLRLWLSKIPGIGTPLAAWFAKYQTVEGVINEIVKNLEDGKSQLERDNTTLKEDQIAMKHLICKLQDYVNFGIQIDQKITEKLESTPDIDPAQRKFIEEEILFSLKQRSIDLQQQLAVNQQGILTSEVIIRNNNELIRGVSRSLNVTVTALNVAATLAVALQTQKAVLRGVQAVDKTTEELLLQTADSLKTQGGEIHKNAASAQLNIESLKKAFEDVTVAINDISTFRRQALPAMSQSIVEMSQLSEKMENSIQKLGTSASHNEIMLSEGS
jgi:uncharacterized protein YaaN involved in tellurite resistance